jgi:hypothetical protein
MNTRLSRGWTRRAQGSTAIHADFAAAFARIRYELKTRITQKVHAAGVTVAEGDLAQT